MRGGLRVHSWAKSATRVHGVAWGWSDGWMWWRQVNKEEAGAAARPVDEEVEDSRGYDWRNKD